ncbi:MAG: flippase [archaeon]
MGIARKFTKNFAYQVGTNLAIKLANLFLVVYLTRLLLPADFGLYSWIISIALLADVFADLGAASTMIRFLNNALSRGKKKEAASYFVFSFRLKIIASATVFALMMLFADVIATAVFHKPVLAMPIRLSALLMLAYTFTSFFQVFFIAIQRNEYVFLGNLLQAISKIALMVGLVILLGSFVGAIIGYALALVLTLILFVGIFLRNYGFLAFGGGISSEKRLGRFAFFSAISSFSIVIFANVDILMISALLPIENVGFYSIAMSWAASIGALVPMFLLFPVFSELASKPLEHLRNAFSVFFKYILLLIVPAAFGLAYFSRPLVELLYRSQYAIVVPPILFVLAFLVLFNSLSSVFMSVFDSLEKPEISAKIFFAGIILDVVLNYFFILRFGVIGAAYATLISYFAMCVAFFALLRPVAGISLKWKPVLVPVASSALMYLALVLLPSPRSVLIAAAYLVFGIIIYAALVFGFGGTNRKEIEYIVSRIRNRN